MPSDSETLDGGPHHGLILVAERAIFARMRIETGNSEARTRDVETVAEIACDDAAGLDDEVGGEPGDDVFEREVDGDRHDRKLGRPQHHHRPHGHAGGFLDELAEVFGMAGFGETRSIEHVLGNRIGHDRAGDARGDVGHGATDRRKRRGSARSIRVARLGADRHADIDHGQRGLEGGAGRLWLHDGDGHVGRDPLGTARHECRVGQEIEGRQTELRAPAPRREGDVGPDSGRLTQRQRQRRRHQAWPTCIRAWRRDVTLSDTAWSAAHSAGP